MSFGSGRHRWSVRETTEQRYAIDVRVLSRAGYLRSGAAFFVAFGTMRAVGQAGFEHVRFTGAVNLQVRIDRPPCHFGNTRAFWRCGCSRRVAILYVDAGMLRCRRCLGLRYASQREMPRDRALRRARAARLRLGGTADVTAPLPARPRGMRRATFARLCQRAIEAESMANGEWRRLLLGG